ncbi:hypothetical protein ACR6C2_30460 [Streptomyces sp. INA 01156]
MTVGVVVGVLGPLLIDVTHPVGHAVHLVLSAGWSWAALAFCVGLARKSRGEAVLLATASLVTAVIAYYLTKLGQGTYLTVDLDDPTGAAPTSSGARSPRRRCSGAGSPVSRGPFWGWPGTWHGIPDRAACPSGCWFPCWPSSRCRSDSASKRRCRTPWSV